MRNSPEYARVREEFEIVSRMGVAGVTADIDSAMLNVDALLAAATAQQKPTLADRLAAKRDQILIRLGLLAILHDEAVKAVSRAYMGSAYYSERERREAIRQSRKAKEEFDDVRVEHDEIMREIRGL